MLRKILRAALLLTLVTVLSLNTLLLSSCNIMGEEDDDNGESVYKNVFVAALGDKYERLLSIKEPKIAVVGGSSVAFGLNSALLARYTGYEVVNFGLFATLGSKIMLDLSEDGLNEGDIVVFAPELDAKTLSLFFGARAAWQAIDASPSLYDTVWLRNGEELQAEQEAFEAEKKTYKEDGAPNPSGVYNRKNFNEYGDIYYDRPYNTMALGYDPNTIFELTPEIMSEDFLTYFNNYCARLREKGVEVYFSFCPINDKSLAPETTEQTLDELERYLIDNLNCPVISSIEDYIMDWGYFYDTNLHLNNAGVTARTEMLINDLRAELGMTGEVMLDTPEPPGLAGGSSSLDGDNTYANLFKYELMKNGDTVLGAKIVGLSEEAANFTGKELVIPVSDGDVPIILIEGDVLGGLKTVEKITIGKNISSIADAAFRGCDALKEIHVEFGTECLVSVPGEKEAAGLMEGAPEGCLIYCEEKYREDFLNHYTWQHYYKYFAR